ncbi:PASTA domain-containing protein [Tamlana sp. I1]|uniref:PASTA domain-containing protein n=1 Tax=Tamlana sp. I1 TaxID=2762061 RepID=UPI001890812E|nr:PASTA domain-containing protein [Tamlana sp. I1]
MSLVKFITSKTFLKQIGLAIVAVVVLCYIILKWLNITTNHGEFETVPDLKGKSIHVAQVILKDNKLEIKVQDSANYNPDYPKYSVIDQEPVSGSKVKEDRKIYVTVNPSGYRKMTIPDGLIDKTFRQVKPTLEAFGFKIGKITYVDNIGKDMVLKLSNKGNTLHAGDKLEKTSVIDLQLGNGNRP